MSIITCPNCGAKNRVDETRADHATPKCGKCGSPLPTDSGPMTITDANFAALVANAGNTPVLVDCELELCG